MAARACSGRLQLGPGTGELGGAGAVAGSAAITNGLLLNTATGKLSICVQSAVLADQFAVGGTFDVSGATLAVDSSAFDPAAGTSYVIVANDGVDAILGTFAGLPEGWIFTANARNYRISYVGGDVNRPPTRMTAINQIKVETQESSLHLKELAENFGARHGDRTTCGRIGTCRKRSVGDPEKGLGG